MLKRILSLLTAVLILIPAVSSAAVVVTSFYPIWLFTLNLTAGLDDVTVLNLASPGTGCLHDYQLQTSDMKSLSSADIFLVNGAGMESYLELVFGAFPDLPVISAAEGIDLLKESDSLQIGEAEDGDTVNAHIWLDAGKAVLMVRNLAEGLMAVMPEHEQEISANRDAFIVRLETLDNTLRDGLKDLPDNRIVTFHEAFPYFASAYGLQVVAVVNREPGETLTPAQMARLAEAEKELGNPPLFVEPQYEDLSARTLAAETGASVWTLDPVVTGPESDVPLDYYETVMLQNRNVLRDALGAAD